MQGVPAWLFLIFSGAKKEAFIFTTTRPSLPKEGTYHPSRPPFLQRREAQPLLLSLTFWHPRPIKESGYSAYIPAYAVPW